jgi:N-acetylmuramoyl-L-alanine amidase
MKISQVISPVNLFNFLLTSWAIAQPIQAFAQNKLSVVYPPAEHQTTAQRIFFIGTAPPDGTVLFNGQPVERSPGGHFAPSFPLAIGENIFTIRHDQAELVMKVKRLASQSPIPTGAIFSPTSLTPQTNMAKMPGELLCFQAIALPDSQVSVQLAGQTIPLYSQSQVVKLPENLAVLTGTNQPQVDSDNIYYKGCATANTAGNLGKPIYQFIYNGETVSQAAPGEMIILSPTTLEIAEVIVDQGVARTGPTTDHSRLTPLPKGTKAVITGREKDFIRLDYGGWIKASETKITKGVTPPRSDIRSVTSRQIPGATEIRFPLQIPVPVTVSQEDQTLTLNLYNTIAQTDTILFNDDPMIKRLDWQPLLVPVGEGEAGVQYKFHLKRSQQWGYQLRYEGTTLVLTIRHDPVNQAYLNTEQPLTGLNILLDPGHGSKNDLGARGPTGYPEKDVNWIVSNLLKDELIKRGATVVLTRQGDDDLLPQDRAKMIEKLAPHLSLSVHYNALPDYGDAVKTKGVGMFWYHPQAHSLAVFLHEYLVKNLNRPAYGVYWNNLALTRPAIAPAILLELGFMINPYEFEWIVNPQEQAKLAEALADGIVAWVKQTQSVTQ